MGIIINILIVLLAILLSIKLTKSFKLYVRIIISIILNLIFGIGAYLITMYSVYLVDTYGNAGNIGIAVLMVLLMHCITALFVFAPIEAFIINKYNLERLTKIKFVIYTIILAVVFIGFNLMI